MKIPPAWNILLRMALAIPRSSVVSDEFLHFFSVCEECKSNKSGYDSFKIFLVSFEHPKSGCFFQCFERFYLYFYIYFLYVYMLFVLAGA